MNFKQRILRNSCKLLIIGSEGDICDSAAVGVDWLSDNLIVLIIVE
jgi:hypothetical protein